MDEWAEVFGRRTETYKYNQPNQFQLSELTDTEAPRRTDSSLQSGSEEIEGREMRPHKNEPVPTPNSRLLTLDLFKLDMLQKQKQKPDPTSASLNK